MFDQKALRKFDHADHNPCLEENALSMRCLEENHYVHKKCFLFFENYNKCKEFWKMIRNQRMQNGIKPVIPTAKERKLILAEREKGKHVFSVKVDDDNVFSSK